ncbi:MAG: hypothetical protein WC146_02645 [Patescibacteria group bacterium]|jgi:hypothetical protein
MRKSSYQIVLFFFLALIIIGGTALFVLRNQVLESLSEQSAPAELKTSDIPQLSATADSLDLSIFNSSKFSSLTNNVVNFDFDNICRRPDAIVVSSVSTSEPPAGAEEESARDKRVLNCVQGNNVPFVRKTK